MFYCPKRRIKQKKKDKIKQKGMGLGKQNPGIVTGSTRFSPYSEAIEKR